MTALSLYWLFLRVILLSFSGFASVPLLRDSLVLDHALITDTQLNDAIAISQASPGPLGLYVGVVGYFVAGLPGALAGVLALMTPAALAVPISQLVRRGRSQMLRGASAGVIIVSCSLMIVTGLHLAPQAAVSRVHGAMIVAGTALIVFSPVKPVWILVGAAIVGLCFR